MPKIEKEKKHEKHKTEMKPEIHFPIFPSTPLGRQQQKNVEVGFSVLRATSMYFLLTHQAPASPMFSH